MWKSIIYKEWLKTKWFLFIFAGLGMLAVGNIFLKVKHDFVFNEASNYWYLILFKGYKYYSLLKFAPVIGGLMVAVAQYFPETVNKRIKLTFHLPVAEDKALIMMMVFGTVCLLSVFALVSVTFLCLSLVFFPIEIYWAAITSLTPWFLAGMACYYLGALIIMEPVWRFRFLYTIVAAAFITPLFFEPTKNGGYAPANPILFLLVIATSIALLFSGYRFRKGEM